jgi:DNA-binding response OmpR family regulator
MSDIQGPSKKAIIIVEDSAAIADLIKDTLNAEPDYQATVVADGGLAIDAVRSVKASLVLLDLMLPGLSGLEIYDIMKADANMGDIPVIFVTASADEEVFKERGLKNIIHKPFDLDELLLAVAKVCRPS